MVNKNILEKILDHEKFKDILIDLNILEKEFILKEKLLKHKNEFEFLELDLKQNNFENNKKNLELFKKEIVFDFNVINIFTDGASSGNPGKSGASCIFFDKNNNEFFRENLYLGINTNNYAEYSAILLAIKNIEIFKDANIFKNFNIDFKDIQFNFFSDSELMVKQLNKKYKISNNNLKFLASNFFKKVEEMNINYNIYHITREKNNLADSLAVLAKNNNLIKDNKIIRQNR